MGPMHLDIDLYFWMIDRGDIEDDQRNKVEMEQQRVRLHRDHAQRIENAYYIGKIMHVIRRTIIKKSKKPFTLDPNLHSMKDQQSTVTKEYNWNLVVQELKKFNIRPTKEQKAQLVGGKQSLMHDIIQQLYEYDQNLLAYNGALGGQNSKSPDRINDNHSELNFIADNPLQGASGRFIKDSDSQAPQSYPIDQSQSKFKPARARNSAAILAGAPTRKPALDPLSVGGGAGYGPGLKQSPTSLAELNDDRSNAQITSELIGYANGNSQAYLSKRLEVHPIRNNGEALSARDDHIIAAYPDAGYQGSRIGLGECSSTLDFILEGLSQSLGMSQSQAAALLANNSKYLMHLCVKGMKGADFSRIVNWYKLNIQYAFSLVELLNFEKNDPQALNMTLNVLKAGLFSSDAEVVNLCFRTLNKISSIIHDKAKSQEPDSPMLQLMLWEWLTQSQNPTPNQNKTPAKGKQTKASKAQAELDSYVPEAGLLGFIRACRKHETEASEIFASALVQFGRENYIELFTYHLKNYCTDELEYLRLIQDILPVLVATNKGRQAFVDSGVINMIIDLCLSICDNFAANNDSRQVAMALLVLIWKTKPEVIQAQENEGRMTDAIIKTLRNGARDTRSKAISVTSINMSFFLLSGFATDRNMFAPILYKALTFVLIDCYMNLELREELLKNFIQLFKEHQNIPINILCEPYLKQITINLEKQGQIQSENQNILQPTSEHFTLNTTDFELFLAIATHPKLTAPIANQLLEIVSQIARKNIIFTRASLKLLLTVLAKFENNTKVFENCQRIVSELIQVIYSQDEAKLEIYNSLKDNPRGKAKRKVQPDRSFNPTLNTNTMNARYLARDAPGGQSDLIDDSVVQAVISPTNNQEESARYMSLKTSEKLIINLLQCLVQTGIKVLADFARTQVLESYVKTEKRLKFRNKGLLYLLSFFEKDVSKLLQFTKKQTQMEKTMKAKQQKLEKQNANFSSINQSADYGSRGYNFDDFQGKNVLDSLDDAMPRRDKRNQNTLGKRAASGYVDQTLKNYNAPRDDDSLQRDSRQGYNMNEYQLYEKGPLFDDPDYLKPPRTLKQKKRSMVDDAIKNQIKQPPKLAGLARRPQQGQLKLFDINGESAQEQQRYLFWVKDWLKLYKAMFNKYAGASSVAKNKAAGTFDNLQNQKQSVSLSQVFAFLSDFKITKLEAKREDIQRIIKLINIKEKANINPVSDLDLESFIEFNLQLGYHLYKNEAPRASKFMPLLFERFREVSLASKLPLFQRLLEDPHAPPVEDQETVQILTQIVNEDPSYELPPGYIKVRADKLREIEGVDPKKYPRQVQQISVQILDDIFDEVFGMKLLEPRIEVEERWVVKPHQAYKKPKQARYLEVGDRHKFKTLAEQEEERKKAYELEKKALQPTYKQSQKRTKDTSNDPYSSDQPRVGYGPNAKKRRVGATTNSSLSLGAGEKPFIVSNRNGIRSPAVQRGRDFDAYGSGSRKKIDYGSIKNKDRNISAALKIELAKRQAQNPDNEANLRESAYLLDDMTQAVESGRTKLSPRGFASPQPRALNRLMELKLEKQQKELNDKLDRESKLARRNKSLKNRLQSYQDKKKEQEALKHQVAKGEIDKQRKAQEIKQQKKKQYYEALRKDYEEERLPQIKENRQLEQELKHWQKEENKKRKKESQGKIDFQTQKLRQNFAEVAIKRDIDQVKKQEEEKLRKMEEIERRERKLSTIRKKPLYESPQVSKYNFQSSGDLQGSYPPDRYSDNRSTSVKRPGGYRNNSLSPGRPQLNTNALKKAQTLQKPKKSPGAINSARRKELATINER